MVVFNVPYASDTLLKPCWNGWIGALFPYNQSGFEITKNEIVPGEVPSGLVYVPFDMSIRLESFKVSFAAVVFGARQDKANEEYVVSPVIGWYIVDKS